jgi:metal-responsive CopG/Arc/MetJ family transcriptional regulator
MPGPKPMPVGRKKQTVCVSLAPDLVKRLNEIAARNMVSRSQWVEQQLRRVIDRLERQAA